MNNILTLLRALIACVELKHIPQSYFELTISELEPQTLINCREALKDEVAISTLKTMDIVISLQETME